MTERRFGWSDMFVNPDEDPRTDGGFKGERATLVGFLRLTLELKCAGLDAPPLYGGGDAEWDGAVPDPRWSPRPAVLSSAVGRCRGYRG